MNILMILNDPPYGTERCYNGLRLAKTLLTKDPSMDELAAATLAADKILVF